MSSSLKHPRLTAHHRSSPWMGGLLSIAGLSLVLGGCTDPVAPRALDPAGFNRGEMVNEDNDARVHIEIDELEQWVPYAEKGLHD